MTTAINTLSVDEIYHILEKEIVTLEIEPRDMLSENTLCKRFNVSRTPIRSVLQRLQQNRFVDIISHKGTIVTCIHLDIVNQIIYKRLAIESMVIRDFIKMATPTDIAKCHFYYERMVEGSHKALNSSNNQHGINDFLQLDLAMHQLWFDATGKNFLWEELTTPQADYSRFIRLDIVGAKNVTDVLKEHAHMLKIIESKEYDAIEPLFYKHLNGGITRLGSDLFSPEYSKWII